METNDKLKMLRDKYAQLNAPCPCCGGLMPNHSPGGIVEDIFFYGYMAGKERVERERSGFELDNGTAGINKNTH